ncbi:MAG: DUF433 domain-containing protein [Acidimicrobiales bacterium]
MSDRIVRDPAVQGGEPVIRGTRIPVAVIGGLAEAGWTVAQIIGELPALCAEDVAAALRFDG